MKKLSLLVAFMAALFLGIRGWSPPVAMAQDPPRPNILYIMADDLGWQDVGFHGSDIKTPNLDRLAQTGVRLEHYHAHPWCTPSRAALMTGRYPFRYGLQTIAIPSAGTYGLATDEWLMPQALQEAGYKTALVGKWHLGHADFKYWPLNRGFDYQYGAILGEIDYFTHSAHGNVDWYRNHELVNEEGYVTTLLGQDAVKLIDEHDTNTPLFLYLAFTAPHAPYQAPEEAIAQYANIEDPNRRAYAAMVTVMDEQIGQVVEALERRGMRDNTLIVFQSDNGGPRSAAVTGEVDTSGGTIPADNGPFRGGKGALYEGGTRVVALANWPGRLAPGTVADQPMHIIDWYPTFANLAGASLAQTKPLDGMNIWPALAQGQSLDRDALGYDIEPFRAAVHQGDWKLVWQITIPSKTELFNLAQDPAEETNLANRNRRMVNRLKQRVETASLEAEFPLVLTEVLGAAKGALFSSVATPEEAEAIDNLP